LEILFARVETSAFELLDPLPFGTLKPAERTLRSRTAGQNLPWPVRPAALRAPVSCFRAPWPFVLRSALRPVLPCLTRWPTGTPRELSVLGRYAATSATVARCRWCSAHSDWRHRPDVLHRAAGRGYGV